VTVGLVYNVKPATAKKKHERKASTPAPKAAVSTNGAAGGTKADAIRAAAKILPKPIRRRDVRAELAKQGIEATTTFIGKVLRAAGMKRKHRSKSAAGSAAPAATSAALSIDTFDRRPRGRKEVGQSGWEHREGQGGAGGVGEVGIASSNPFERILQRVPQSSHLVHCHLELCHDAFFAPLNVGFGGLDRGRFHVFLERQYLGNGCG
jgi:hypothetical protein